MKRCLIDAGPLIALFNNSDRYHQSVLEFIRDYQGVLLTTWPVITEVCYMLNFSNQAQTDFLKWISIGAVRIHEIGNLSMDRLIELINKYNDVPMDLADASLVLVSEETVITEIISIDSDFNIYRNNNHKFLKNIFQ